LEEDGYPSLARFRKEHFKVKSVHYWWLDEFVDKITFGQGHTLTIHWKDGQESKNGFETTVKMIVNFSTTDPVLLAQQVEKEIQSQPVEKNTQPVEKNTQPVGSKSLLGESKLPQKDNRARREGNKASQKDNTARREG